MMSYLLAIASFSLVLGLFFLARWAVCRDAEPDNVFDAKSLKESEEHYSHKLKRRAF